MASTECVRKQGLDKFYTIPSISLKCIQSVKDLDSYDLVVEPSAGNGSFYNQLPHETRVGIDISPECEGIIEQNFYDYTPPPECKKVLVIGNPPFGRVCSDAVKFFNHAAKWAHTIAFIIPRTFKRTSIHNRLSMDFVLVSDEDIPTTPCSFEPPMSVKCCFQVWHRTQTPRTPVTRPTTHKDWEFLKYGPKDEAGKPTPPEGADFAILAYGGKCGRIVEENLHTLSPKSWHWIKANIDKDLLIARFKELDYSKSVDTARQNSMGKADLIELYRM